MHVVGKSDVPNCEYRCLMSDTCGVRSLTW